MRSLKLLLTSLLFVLAIVPCFAQETVFQTGKRSKIEPLPLGISNIQTTNLVFPFAIVSVDRGTADVLVQKARGIENILQLKAAKDSFQQTNLSVVTADGSLYSFVLNYSTIPTSLNVELQTDKPVGVDPLAIFSKEVDNRQKLISTAEYISAKQKTVGRPIHKANGMQFSVKGIFIKDDLLYFNLRFVNNSNINHHIGQFRFYIVDKKKSKRTASQELEQIPVYTHGNRAVIYNNGEQNIVVVLNKFTIPNKKQLIVELLEKNGGRNLKLKMGNKLIMNATPFN